MELYVFHAVAGATMMTGLYHLLFFLLRHRLDWPVGLFSLLAITIAAALWAAFARGFDTALLTGIALGFFVAVMIGAFVFLGRFTDAFDRVLVQEKRLSRNNLRLEEKVRERTAELEVLFRELQHRVKNNLQVILGLAWLQQERSGDPAVRAVLGELAGRIRAIALVHEALKLGQGSEPVEIDAYLQRLLEELAKAYNRGGLWFAYQGEGLRFSADRAVEIGLIVNEAVTNALLHAFKNEENPWVEVSLRLQGESCLLGIVDNGPGLPENPSGGGLGLGLMQDIARRKLGGECVLLAPDEGGCEVRVTFPILD